ncbi:dTDP-4-dehydrorhamnose 3,5-epimerase [Alcanivorax marinus]|uniref:dTDP-4-dehydrorhamnose 3,5-epimerase n=1 Tax=Alloalcanivorax marinus TaxID=1177169 RepID=A0A9Q3UQA4_9GAMM|nr:dTDP-4-dehydrorhamnose 3,5-epimerase [Alloalcanivorax marinus]MCC4309517.1 dTDP-4-dehydrorhamnose 3,5-epimerase [Alloalcanivorax marinus]
MEVTETRIPDVKLIKPKLFGDERGFFMETWNARAFAKAGIDASFVQDNHSRSVRHTLRGLHYQLPPHAQGKLVRVTRGEVFDVAVDIRKGSPTFGQWVGEVLSEENQSQLWVPPGFAHGFYVMSDSADFQYKCTEFYAPGHERCIRWDASELNIDWPILDNREPLVSEKDRNASNFLEAELYGSD